MKTLGKLGRTSAALAATSALLVGAGGLAAWAGELVTAEVESTVNDVSVEQGGSTNFTIKLSATGKNACGATSTATVKTSYAFDAAGTLSSSTPSSAYAFSSPGSGTNCDVTWTGAPTPYGAAASVSTDASTPVGSYSITLSEAAGTTATTNSNATQGKLEDKTATVITVHVTAADSDDDGVPDTVDNCLDAANSDQADSDGDGIGDVCDTTDPDPDTDGDGVLDADDNCPNDANANQADADGDRVGDVCDPNAFAPELGTGAADVMGDEGDTLSTSGSFTDGDGTETLSVSHSPSNVGDFNYNSATGVWTWSLATTDDVPLGSVTVTASDGEHTDATDIFKYEALNVAPDITSAQLGSDASSDAAIDCRSSVTLSFSFDDPGTDDTWTATVNWGDGNEESVTATLGANSISHPYTTGGLFTPTLTVEDDNDGSDSTQTSNSVDVDQYTVQFLKPFDQSTDGSYVINKAKAGRTVPVKVTLDDKCAGAAVTGASGTVPSIGIHDASVPSNATSDALEVYSDAGASNLNGKYFRWADGFWIYNADTKAEGLQVGKTYRINVRMDGALATDDEWALLQLTK